MTCFIWKRTFEAVQSSLLLQDAFEFTSEAFTVWQEASVEECMDYPLSGQQGGYLELPRRHGGDKLLHGRHGDNGSVTCSVLSGVVDQAGLPGKCSRA